MMSLLNVPRPSHSCFTIGLVLIATAQSLLAQNVVTPGASSQSYESISVSGGNIVSFNNSPWELNNGQKDIGQTFDNSGMSAAITNDNLSTVTTTITDFPNNAPGWWVAPNDEKTGVLRFVFDESHDFTDIALWANTPVSGKGNFAPSAMDVWVGDGTDYTQVLMNQPVAAPGLTNETFSLGGTFSGTEIVLDFLGSQTTAGSGEVGLNEFRAIASVPEPHSIAVWTIIGLVCVSAYVCCRKSSA